MNRKLEEKLIRLAFGDLDVEEAALVRQELRDDPSADQLLREFSGIREDLRSLREIPSHQMSTESLRHAIESRGVRPAPRTGIGWLWMPVAASVLAFALFSYRNQSLVDTPTIVGVTAPSVDLRLGEKVLKLDGHEPTKPLAATSQAAEAAPRQSSTVVAKSDATRRKPRAKKSEPMTVVRSEPRPSAWQEPMAPPVAAARGSIEMVEPPPSFSVAPMSAKAAVSSQPIVFIKTESDRQTGANIATEETSIGNVLISG